MCCQGSSAQVVVADFRPTVGQSFPCTKTIVKSYQARSLIMFACQARRPSCSSCIPVPKSPVQGYRLVNPAHWPNSSTELYSSTPWLILAALLLVQFLFEILSCLRSYCVKFHSWCLIIRAAYTGVQFILTASTTFDLIETIYTTPTPSPHEEVDLLELWNAPIVVHDDNSQQLPETQEVIPDVDWNCKPNGDWCAWVLAVALESKPFFWWCFSLG